MLPQQGFDISWGEVRVQEPAKACASKENLQQGTVLTLALFVTSAILRAPVTDEPLHTTRALHFADVPQTERRLKGVFVCTPNK